MIIGNPLYSEFFKGNRLELEIPYQGNALIMCVLIVYYFLNKGISLSKGFPLTKNFHVQGIS